METVYVLITNQEEVVAVSYSTYILEQVAVKKGLKDYKLLERVLYTKELD